MRILLKYRMPVLAVIAALSMATPLLAGVTLQTMLPNGLKVLTKEVHSAPIVTVQVWYHAGSRNEYTGVTGTSHILEHMLFKGTTNYKKGEMTRLIRRKGGVDNAGTWTDFTEYYELMSSEYLDFMLRIEADRMVNALIDPKELKAEAVVVRSELEGRESRPDTLLWDEVTATAFKAHPYQWPVIGWKSDVEAVSREQVYQRYRQYYTPGNATLVIVGDFDTNKALALVRKYFGGLPKRPVPPAVRTVEPPQYGERRVRLERAGTAQRAIIAYHAPAISSPDAFPLVVLDQILSGGKSSRLYQALVEKELATDAWSSITPRKDPTLLYIGATARTGVTAEQIEAELLRQVEQLREAPVSDEELTRAKNQIEASFVFSKDSVSDQAEQLGFYDTVANWRLVDQYVPKIKAVTKDDVQRVAQRYLVETNRTVGWFVPRGQEGGANEDHGAGAAAGVTSLRGLAAEQAFLSGGDSVSGLKRLSNNVLRNTIASPSPLTLSLKGEGNTVRNARFSPFSPGGEGWDEGETRLLKQTVKSRNTNTETTERVRPFRVVLPNGMVVIVQENHSNSTVAIRGNLKAGAIFDPLGKQGLAGITAEMLNRGTTSRTALQLAEETESVGASANVRGGNEAAAFFGSALTKDFPLIVDILADKLRNPSFPEDQFEKLRGEELSALQQETEDPDRQASRVFSSAVFPANHPYHRQSLDEDISDLKSITLQDAQAFYQKYYSPESTVVVIVGDVDRQAAVDVITQRFGSWVLTGGAAKVEIPNIQLQPEAVKKIIPMMDKSEVSIFFGHAGMLARSSPEYYAANVMNQILGGAGALSSRMGKSIRDNLGLVYDVYSTFNATLGEGAWYAALGTNPKNADKAIAEMKAIISRMRDKGATQDEVNEAVEFMTGYFPIRLETNDGVATMLLNAEFYGLGMDYIQRFSKIYRAVTLQQVNVAAKKYLRPDRATLVIAGPYQEAK